jgi:hypothetical protein
MAGSGWVTWLVSGVAIGVLATSCGNDTAASGPTVTPPAADGGDGGASGGGSLAGAGAGAGDASVLPGRPDGLPWLGMACRRAEDCGEQGLRCLTDNEDFMDGQGAPAGGLCTTDCEADADCRAFDATAVCATLAEAPLVLAYAATTVQRLCMPGCELGAPSGATKCHGRADMACRPFAPDHPATCFLPTDVCPDDTFCYRGACRELACGPRCNADSDCNANRHCNFFTGLCDIEAPEPVPVGADCPNDELSNTCGGGNCLELSDAEGARVKRACTHSCTIGQVCGEGTGACVLPRFQNFSVGDAGYCVQRCDCDSDCRHPLDRCVPFGDAETEKAYGSHGVCDAVPEGTVTLTCDDGQGGAGGAGSAGASGAAGASNAGASAGGAGGGH